MLFADINLARRLERAEGRACVEFAEARRRLLPESGAESIQHAGVCAVFDGIDSPVTQSFGLGIFEKISGDALDLIERFFFERGTSAQHEVCPLAGVAALKLLCQRNYRPIEISSVLYRAVEKPELSENADVRVRLILPDEAQIWTDVNTRAWTHEHPELNEFFVKLGNIPVLRKQSLCFLAEFEGIPAAAGMLFIHERVALFCGAATVPELRRRGLQAALLQERMRFAFENGCDLAMMVADAGSNSQRNAERRGFQVAYTRMKWRLSGSDAP